LKPEAGKNYNIDDIFVNLHKLKMMNRQALIKSTIIKISQLPDVKINEVNDFIDFLPGKIDDNTIREGIQISIRFEIM